MGAWCLRRPYREMSVSPKLQATANQSFIMISDHAELKPIVNLQRRLWPMNKRPLGRGLSALISTDSPRAEGDEIREIEIDLIPPGPQQRPPTLSPPTTSRR